MKIVDSLLPSSGKYSLKEGKPIDIKKARSLQILNVFVILMAFLLVLFRSIIEGKFPPDNIATVYLCPILILGLVSLKYFGSLRTSALIITTGGYIGITMRLLYAGGLSTANIVLYTVFPLCSYVFLNDRTYILQTIGCILTVIGFYIFIPNGLIVPKSPETPLIKTYIFIICLLIDVAMIWLNEHFREEYYQDVKKLEKQKVGINIISAMNHELLNPLNLLKGSIQIARKEDDENEWLKNGEKYVEQIEKKVFQFKEIINKYELERKDGELISIDSIKKELK